VPSDDLVVVVITPLPVVDVVVVVGVFVVVAGLSPGTLQQTNQHTRIRHDCITLLE